MRALSRPEPAPAALTPDQAQAELVETLVAAKLCGRPALRTGPSLLELETEPSHPAWWQWRLRAARRRRREAVAGREYATGLISFATYRRVTPWLWAAPDADSVW